MAELAELERRMNAARAEHERFLDEAKNVRLPGNTAPGDMAHVLKTQVQVETRRVAYEMLLADWARARDEEARAIAAKATAESEKRTAEHEKRLEESARDREEARKRWKEVDAENERAEQRAEQRHRDEMARLQEQSVKHQREANATNRRMVWLTVIIVAITLASGALQAAATWFHK